jgi:hypothetical protein
MSSLRVEDDGGQKSFIAFGRWDDVSLRGASEWTTVWHRRVSDVNWKVFHGRWGRGVAILSLETSPDG